MTLFETGDFTLHSGSKSTWKIDCDALTDQDLATLAREYAERAPSFQVVVGIPTGGERFARALLPHRQPRPENQPLPMVLLVDDVLTTGGSMNVARRGVLDEMQVGVRGLVIFSRAQHEPPWITALFRLPGWWRDE